MASFGRRLRKEADKARIKDIADRAEAGPRPVTPARTVNVFKHRSVDHDAEGAIPAALCAVCRNLTKVVVSPLAEPQLAEPEENPNLLDFE